MHVYVCFSAHGFSVLRCFTESLKMSGYTSTTRETEASIEEMSAITEKYILCLITAFRKNATHTLENETLIFWTHCYMVKILLVEITLPLRVEFLIFLAKGKIVRLVHFYNFIIIMLNLNILQSLNFKVFSPIFLQKKYYIFFPSYIILKDVLGA